MKKLIIISLLLISGLSNSVKAVNDPFYLVQADKIDPETTEKISEPSEKNCPNCDEPMPKDAKFCPHCGFKLTSTDIHVSPVRERKNYYRKIEFSLFLAFLGGEESPPVGMTLDGKEIKNELGGRIGYGLANSIYFTRFLKLKTSFGYYWGAFNINVSNADGTFSRLPLKSALLFHLSLGELFDSLFHLTAGPGMGIYFSPTLAVDAPDYKSELNYKTALGAEVIIGLHFTSLVYDYLFGYFEFRYSPVTYKFKDGVENGTKLVPGNIQPQWKELNGDGMGLYLGIGLKI
ncbi:MAG: zinc-ribbon domain-containing protein [Spirochaetes bacterium]|nr:zinc-ribbon domain-containing protein [Spirochaetota bacterium]